MYNKGWRPEIGPFLVGTGGLLFLWGLASWFLPFEAGDPFYADTASSLLYTLMGSLLVWCGFGWSPDVRHAWSRNAGLLFLLLGAAGFAVSGSGIPNLGVTNLELAENVFHLALGALLLLGGLRVLTQEVYLVPRRYRHLLGYRLF
jgi:hypothetical protein